MKRCAKCFQWIVWFSRWRDERLSIMILPHAGGKTVSFQINYLHFIYFVFLLSLSIFLWVFSYQQKEALINKEMALKKVNAQDRRIINHFKQVYGQIGATVFNLQKDAQDIYLVNHQSDVRNSSEFQYLFGEDSISWVDSVSQIFERKRMALPQIRKRIQGTMDIVHTATGFYKNYKHFNPDKINLLPVHGYLVRGFDLSVPHTGLDIAAPKWRPIVAAASGRVIRAGYHGGYGLVVILLHRNGKKTLYAHNTKVKVSYGDWVEKGQVISYLGTTGNSSGYHIHFEVRVNDRPVDPYPYVGFFIPTTKVNPDFWKKQNPLFGIGSN